MDMIFNSILLLLVSATVTDYIQAYIKILVDLPYSTHVSPIDDSVDIVVQLDDLWTTLI